MQDIQQVSHCVEDAAGGGGSASSVSEMAGSGRPRGRGLEGMPAPKSKTQLSKMRFNVAVRNSAYMKDFPEPLTRVLLTTRHNMELAATAAGNFQRWLFAKWAGAAASPLAEIVAFDAADAAEGIVL